MSRHTRSEPGAVERAAELARAGQDAQSEPWPVPSGRRAVGHVAIPPSKSVTHRFVNLALLTRQAAIIERPLYAEDTRLFFAALRTCGYLVEEDAGEVRIAPPAEPALAGAGGSIFCGNAGTVYRFLVASLATIPGVWTLDGVPRLRERPVGPLVAALRGLGAHIEEQARPGYAPLRIAGGDLRGGRVALEAGESSQYLSALLMAGQRAAGPIEIEVSSLVSSPYVELTRDAIAAFGGRVEGDGRLLRTHPMALAGGRFRVEADDSAAAYPAAAAALTGGRVSLVGLRRDSLQGDRRFLEVLRTMGADVEWQGAEAVVTGARALRGIDVDFSALPDQVPTLAALAPFAAGVTRITGVPHLRIKESDRLAAMAQELARIGAVVEELPDGLVIPGVWERQAPPADEVTVDPHGDHRIAMSLAIAGLRRPGIRIADPHVVAKSWPDFFRAISSCLTTESI